jgi:hypothetical protein
VPAWLRDAFERGSVLFGIDRVHLLNGDFNVVAKVGDWIIRDAQMRLTVMNDDCFRLLCEPLEDPPVTTLTFRPIGEVIP